MPFTVDKWYLDLVTAEGAALVGYVAGVCWNGLDLRLASRLLVEPTGARLDQSSLREAVWPARLDDRVTWTSEPLGLRGEWTALEAPIGRTLLTSADGTIEWRCEIPRARATVVTPSARYEGLGYVEHLRLTLPPWAFPFHTLRWGRHLSDRHGLVWIEWDGATPMRVAWLDGEVQPAAQVTGAGVSGLSNASALAWHDSRDLCQRVVGPAVARAAPALTAPVAGRLARMQEHKQLSASALVDADGTPLDAGWTIHEVVTW